MEVGASLGVNPSTALEAFRRAGEERRPVGTNQWGQRSGEATKTSAWVTRFDHGAICAAMFMDPKVKKSEFAGRQTWSIDPEPPRDDRIPSQQGS